MSENTDSTPTTTEGTAEVVEAAEAPQRRRAMGMGRLQLTDAEIAAVSARAPHEPVKLGDGDLACRDCGVQVPGPIETSTVAWIASDRVEIPESGHLARSAHREPMTTCDGCVHRRDVAAALVAEHLPNGITVGDLKHGPEVATELVAASLAVLAVIDKADGLDHIDGATLTMAVRRFATLGVSWRWSRRFGPVRSAAAATANARPWSHVKDRQKGTRAWVHFFADRLAKTAPPLAITPPTLPDHERPRGSNVIEHACLLCGVGAVSVAAIAVARQGGREAAAASMWSLRTAVSPRSLGAHRSPATVTGWTCPPCSEAINRAGAVGPTATEVALIGSLGLGSRWSLDHALSGIVAWGGIVADALRTGKRAPEANREPWAHLGDLDALKARIAPDLGVSA